ncbi:outer membrane usher protein [Enterobacter pseudoroggenkampii]|uniref:outer membrane usher protein n=1 Tax=Enterobacter pseudoroggenkampii TaxID=2996112 RepID=UPI00066655A8|nr:outer membrane usher protein [Enterobacter pseudoroggenkampii]WJW95435.1 outer membrane usher protein [Enterobacter pseudoroggenkampii]
MLFRRSFLCIAICTAFQSASFAADKTPAPSSGSEEVEFNDQFLFNTGANIDVSRFSRGNPVIPGTFKTQLVLNGQKKILTDFTFKENGTPRATPCFTPKLLMQIGIKADALKNVLGELDFEEGKEVCINISEALTGASWDFNAATQELSLVVPQVFVERRPNGYVDPSLWEDGITAGMLSYDLNAWHSDSTDGARDTAYAGLKYGLNMGPWRLRSRGTLNWSQDDGSDYSSQDIYLQRDITPLRAQLLLGDSFTRGDTFNSFSLRGARMYNDDRMLPGGISTYAPTIRGVAKSNAKVTVTQSGNKIFESTVPPGAFELNDLSTTGYGSDLVVTIEESDGSTRTFSVPYSSVSQMLRPGYSRWDIGVGELNDDSLRDKPRLGYATGYYGINNTFTGYTGFQYMDTGYLSGLIGIAMNTPIGAFALDVTHSDANIDGLDNLSGQSYRVSWSKLLTDTNTSFNVAAYRFSTQNYLTLNDAASLADDVKYRDKSRNPDHTNEDVYNSFQRMKNQVQVNISQPLSSGKENYGSLYITGSWQDYWTDSSSTSQYSMGYNSSFWLGSYSVSLQRSYDAYGAKDDSVYVNLSIPLENLFGHGKHPGGFSSVNMSVNSDFKDSSAFNTSANGNSDDYRFSYSVNTSTSHADSGDLNQIGGYGSYSSPYGPLSLSASASDDSSQQYSLSYSGGMLVHSGGITLAPGSIGDTDTLALVSAPGAKGAQLTVGDGVIGSSGYAIMPYLSAYRENTVGIDIARLESDVEVKNTSTVAVPRSGAIVRVDFETDQGRSMLLDLHRSDNGFIPLGADVQNDKGQSVGSVGQAGQAYVRGIDDRGTLRVVWGSEANSTCTVTYNTTSSTRKVGLTTMLDNQSCQM